jgi:hypothetical protein
MARKPRGMLVEEVQSFLLSSSLDPTPPPHPSLAATAGALSVIKSFYARKHRNHWMFLPGLVMKAIFHRMEFSTYKRYIDEFMGIRNIFKIKFVLDHLYLHDMPFSISSYIEHCSYKGN